MNILVIPDVHGRTFWKCAQDLEKNYSEIIFLGDYLDPYGFDGISVEEAIDNFKEILKFAKENREKTTLLLGNHDLPYYSEKYYWSGSYHSRHSKEYHNTISGLFRNNLGLFSLVKYTGNIIFSHAGILSRWADIVSREMPELQFKCPGDSEKLNTLLQYPDQMTSLLYMVSGLRGGMDSCGSCIWADVAESLVEQKPFISPSTTRQIFGHTLQGHYTLDGDVVYDDPIEGEYFKMLDNGRAYNLDSDSFLVKQI